ncbi:MAG: TolC family protein, partial [Peptococcaceae bacterium]
SMAASMQSSLDSALDGIDQLNDSLDSISNNKDDLSKGIKDLETQMRYTSAKIALSIVQLDKGIELIEDQIALLEKSVQIAELQQKLGMNIVTDVESQQTSLKDAQKNLEDQKETLSTLKRTLNILIGRNAGNPLEVVPMNLPVAIDPAPAYTEKLIQQFTDSNYTLKTLERDKADLKEDGEDKENKLGSDELKNIDYQIEAKNQEIKDQKQAISDDLKALLAKINSDGEAYKVSRQKYVTEKKNFEYTQKKYELGMISAIQLQQAELQLKQAEMTNMQNGYQFYLDWQKYYAAEKGVDMSNF